MGDSHTFSATTGAGLEHNRVADLTGAPYCLIGVGDHVVKPGHCGNARVLGERLRRNLVPHDLDRSLGGTDECDARCLKPGKKCWVLRQKAVSRVHRLRPRPLTRADDLLDPQIAFA